MKTYFFTLLIAGMLLGGVTPVHADPVNPVDATHSGASFVPLTQIPAFQNVANTSNLASFFNDVYKYCIGIAAVLAVLQIMRAGIMYMSPDSIGEKAEAKNLIGLSLFGLILVLSPVIVFSIIDPRILNLHLDLSPLHPSVPAAATPAAPTAPAQPTNGALSTGEEFPVGSPVSCLYPGGGQGNKIATVLDHVSSSVSGNFLKVQFNDPSLGSQNGTVSLVAPGDCHGYQANTADTGALNQFTVNDEVFCKPFPPHYTRGIVKSIDSVRGWLSVEFHTPTRTYTESASASSCVKSGSPQEQQLCGTPPNCTAGVCEENFSSSGSVCEPILNS